MQGKIPASPNPRETPVEIPGFEAYSALGMVVLLIALYRKKKDKKEI